MAPTEFNKYLSFINTAQDHIQGDLNLYVVVLINVKRK